MKKLAALVMIAVIVGCGKSEESAAKRVGGRVGETVTDFVRGVGKGVDKKLMLKVELSEEMTAQGLSMTIAKPGDSDSNMKAVVVYLMSKQPFAGRLVARAVNKERQEIGRSVVPVEFALDDAQYVTFLFDDELDTELVQVYTLEIMK